MSAFTASDYPGLPQAFRTIRDIANNTQPDNGRPMLDWPDQCGEIQALYVAELLTDALKTISQHIDAIAKGHPGNESLSEPNLRGHLTSIQQAVDDLRTATGDDIPRRARPVHDSVTSLASYLAAGAGVLTELGKALEAHRLAAGLSKKAVADTPAEQPQLPADLVQAVTVLLRHATHAAYSNPDLREAMRTARSYLPRPFAAEDITGLPHAIGVVAALAAGRNPSMAIRLPNGSQAICFQCNADHVSSVLSNHKVMPLLVTHATKLAEVTLEPRLIRTVMELNRQVVLLDDTAPDGLHDWARFVQGKVVELHGYLLGVPHRHDRVRL